MLCILLCITIILSTTALLKTTLGNLVPSTSSLKLSMLTETGICDLTSSLKVTFSSWRCTNGLPDTNVCSGSNSTWTGVSCVSGVVTALDIRSSGLTGTISSSIGLILSLRLFRLGSNNIIGTLPTTLGYLTKLTQLDFQSTSVSGTIPTELGYLSQLASLNLNHTLLTGLVPSSLCQISTLTYLAINSDQINCYSTSLLFGDSLLRQESVKPTPHVPLLISSAADPLPPMHNKMIPESVTAAAATTQDSAMCDLAAALVVTYSSWGCANSVPSLTLCSGSTTLWDGVTCSVGGTVTDIDLQNTGLTGSIPSSIGKLTTLIYLRLGGNCITGSLPTTIGLLSSLTYFGVSPNQLTSTVPTVFGYLTKLSTLYIYTNSFSGSVPSTLCSITSLNILSFGTNFFTCYASCLTTVTTLYTGSFSKCTPSPTYVPTSAMPTVRPTMQPTRFPSNIPSSRPTASPSAPPSFQPTSRPTTPPSTRPTSSPTILPSRIPTVLPTLLPTMRPTTTPSRQPTVSPSMLPSFSPSSKPTETPTPPPTAQPTSMPTAPPTEPPSSSPSTPSQNPTAQPSGEPTSPPSNQPTSFPTGHPTGTPTIPPTSRPTSQPSTGQPIGHPSGQPSGHPSDQPSGQPSITPTGTPTNRPTSNPTSKPTGSPTGQPSVLPSAQPSAYPSSVPTGQPSIHPTGTPTNQPSSIPTSQPSGQPSAQPSAQPSTQPTSHPSNSPTSKPTAEPSKLPSSLPTAQPSSHPTSSPSHKPSPRPSTSPTSTPTPMPTALPSSLPTLIPSSTPSRRPSVTPTRTPTAKPTLQPVSMSPTSVPVLPPTPTPTVSGATNPPSVSPSSAPTWNLRDYQTKRIYYSEYKPLINDTTRAIAETHKVFSSFTYKGHVKEGGCEDWKSFATISLNLPVKSYYFSTITATFGFESFRLGSHSKVTAVCSDPSTVTAVVSTLRSKSITSTYPDYIATCSRYTWRVFTCNDSPVLCLNCSGDCSCPGLSTTLTSSCVSSDSCQANTASYNHLVFQLNPRILYPALTLLAIEAHRTSIEIVANISSTGRLYCWAAPENTFLSSAYSVKQYGVTQLVMDAAKNLSLSLTGLSPDTIYHIYCYTEDASGNGMDLTSVLRTLRTVSTRCCPSVAFTTTYSSIMEYSSDDTLTDPDVFSFSLERTPAATQRVRLGIVAVPCSGGVAYQTTGTTAALAYPSSFAFATGSLVLSDNFVVRGSPGCYEITASGTGLRNSSLSLSIYNSSTTIDPTIKSAYFSSDASSIYIFFETATNYGKGVISKYSSGFTCNQLLLFRGSASFVCKWLSRKLLYAYLVSKSAESPAVGDVVQLLPGVLSPACTGKVCSSADSSAVSIKSPTSPVDPSAALSAPALVSSCSDIILDPTASVGQGLKDWSTVQWYVSSDDFDISLIDSFLNTYHNSTTSSITIPNSYLTSGSINFSLYLVNFLGHSSFATANVVISSSSDIPYTTISGTSTVSLYRWQSLTLFASATVSTCMQSSTNTTTTTSSALSYSWKVYQGLVYRSSLSSSSLNPRYFKLPAYSLDTLSQYTVQVTTTSVATGSFSSATVFVYVKRSGIVALIGGGAKRVVSSLTAFTLDASTSYDEDYPASGSGSQSQGNLTYTWSCVALTPIYGDSCGATFRKTAVLVIPAQTLAARTYNFTVIAASGDGAIGTASTTIVVLAEALPTVTFSGLKAKYNPEDRIQLGVTVEAAAVLATEWTCPGCGLNLSGIALTPLTYYFGIGSSLIQLSLASYSFQSRLSYTLQLTCSYYNLTKPTSSYAQVTVTMNSPPLQGELTVDPTTGYALLTSFYLNTYGWIDDASDYPISYTMTYYTKDSSSTSMLKSLGELQYTSAFLGQGLSTSNYTVTCRATAADIYGCSNTVDVSIRVLPPVNTLALQTSMTAQLALAAETSNPELTMQTSSAATSSLNAGTCTAAPDCTALNRSTCDSVANTCGPCLSGYLGVAGYANSGCQLAENIRTVGEYCTLDADCVTGSCSGNLCTAVMKSCQSNCSNNGICEYVDANGNSLSTCDANSYFCKAKCNCHSARYGADCSLSLSEYSTRRNMRERMCSQLYGILDIQDTSTDVIAGRATLLSSLLLDATQLTDSALSNCTLALTTTVLQHASLCAGDAVYGQVIAALSGVLESGQSLTPSLSSQVSTSIDDLMTARQLSLVVNEESSVVTDNLRLTSTVSYKSDLDNQLYSLPQYDLEAFTQVTPVQVQVASTASDASAMVRVSLSQSNVNYRNASTDASIVKLQVSYDSTTAATTAKLYLQNNRAMEYPLTEPYNTTVHCASAATSYNKSANCSQDPTITVYCPGTTTRTVTAVCPASQYLPQCLSWNGVEYYQDPSCQRVTYSPTNTSCECSGSTGYVSRRQLDAATDVNRMAGEFSASAMIEVQAFVSTWSSAADLSASSITDNYYIVMTVSIICFFFIAGFLNIFCKNRLFPPEEESESAIKSKEAVAAKLTLENANEFFDSILPVEFKFRPWYANFWIKLLECHPHLAYFAPARGRRLYHTKMWLGFCFELLFFIFMDSIFSPLAAADDSTCAVYATPAACVQPLSFDMISALCVWDTEAETCVFNPPENSFTVTLMVVLVASLCSQPLAALSELLVDLATASTDSEFEAEERKEEEVFGNLGGDGGKKVDIHGDGSGGHRATELVRVSPSSCPSSKPLPPSVTRHYPLDSGGDHALLSASIVDVSTEDLRKIMSSTSTSNIDTNDVKDAHEDFSTSKVCKRSLVDMEMVVEDVEDSNSVVPGSVPSSLLIASGSGGINSNGGGGTVLTVTPPRGSIEMGNREEFRYASPSAITSTLLWKSGTLTDDGMKNGVIKGSTSVNVPPFQAVPPPLAGSPVGGELRGPQPQPEPLTSVSGNRASDDRRNNKSDKSKDDKHHWLLHPEQQQQQQQVSVLSGTSSQRLTTIPSLMMLAARLILLQTHLDNTTPEEELEFLLKESSELYETDVMADASATMTLLHRLGERDTNNNNSNKSNNNTMNNNTTADIVPSPAAATAALTGRGGRDCARLLRKIAKVRVRAAKLVAELEEIDEDEAKEKYLMKRFMVELKKGVYKKVIFRHFFELEEEEEEESVHWLTKWLSAAALLLLAVGCLFYILLTGISLGQPTTILWLQVLAIGIVQDVFLLKPLGIWFRFIAIASIVSDSVRHVTDLVHDRVHLILRRTKGVVRHNSLLVQHFNAACRAARVFPHLQTSRLLIALNDYDLPKSLPPKRRLLKLCLDMVFLFFVLLILLLTLLPELFQETIIEASMTTFINFPIYALVLLANLNVVLPVVVVIGVIIIFISREYWVRRCSNHSKKKVMKARNSSVHPLR